MSYNELVQAFFERSVALQWYWTVYVVVIGGVLGFSTFRQRPETMTVILVTVLYAIFAYKNLGAIEVTLMEREAFRSALLDYPVSGEKADDVKRIHNRLKDVLPLSEPTGVWYFHVACDLLTILAVWVKEWHRWKTAEQAPARVAV